MAQMRRIPLLFALTLSLGALAGCGDGEEEPESSAAGGDPAAAREGIAGDADPEAVKVISMWARELRRGDIGAAADLFAIPSLAENAPIRVRIESRREAELFNASLPCGGRLIRAEGEGEFTTATFRLTERPGPGRCGDGTGETAKTAFVIRDGLIVEWRRVGLGPPTTPGQQI
jgi:hypothetical protein